MTPIRVVVTKGNKVVRDKIYPADADLKALDFPEGSRVVVSGAVSPRPETTIKKTSTPQGRQLMRITYHDPAGIAFVTHDIPENTVIRIDGDEVMKKSAHAGKTGTKQPRRPRK